ncbi:MAG: S8 family serine peptidase, partial [Candidatus Thorarchaeota archaeon]|nr:S8 family serine peptidase [Candidatus Thorarchaeota archaeon]
MQRKLVSVLLMACLVLSSIPALFYLSSVDDQQTVMHEATPLDFSALTEVYGEQIPVVVKFENGLTTSLLDTINSLDLEFSLGSPSMSHVGPYYLLDGSAVSLESLMSMNVVSEIAAQTHAQFLESPRDISIPEINADDVWNALDDFGRNVTGEGILIADLDSGVDWRHPDLWFADGGSHWYVNATSTGFLNGSDGVDFNRDFALDTNETLYALDLDRNGVFDVRTEWLWADNLIQNAIPDVGELFFVVNDTSGNGLLDGWEDLVLLGTPKTRYIVERDGSPMQSLQVWDREQNLTLSNHRDTMANGGGHGTAVAGILLGGQLGFRQWVGVAPGAELMMIRVIGDENTTLSIEEGLAYANATGADVI